MKFSDEEKLHDSSFIVYTLVDHMVKGNQVFCKVYSLFNICPVICVYYFTDITLISPLREVIDVHVLKWLIKIFIIQQPFCIYLGIFMDLLGQ